MPVLVEADPTLVDTLAAAMPAGSQTVSTPDRGLAWLDQHPDEYVLVFGPTTTLDTALATAEDLRIQRPTVSVVLVRDQFDTENCVAHNGSLIPVQGRDVMVQSWYQGGVQFWDFTDPDNPRDLGYFERGPLSPTNLGGTWSAYYYNGHVYSSDIQKGFDVLRITDASLKKAADVKMDTLNVQSQPVYRK